MMNVSIRKFEERDIPYKVKWINDTDINRFLHYDLPLEEEKTRHWYQNNKNRTDRYDAAIDVDGLPVGLIGLLSINETDRKAEYYITLGDRDFYGKGVATKASHLLLDYAFGKLGLNRIYLYTESENIAAQRLFERIGFKKEGLIKQDLFYKGRFVDRYEYGICRDDYLTKEATPIQSLGCLGNNCLYIKREDLLPFSFGGNKARKAKLFFEEIDRQKANYVLTYGSGSSNHCRVIANMAAAKNLPCRIISPKETAQDTLNTKCTKFFGAEIITCPVAQVAETISCQTESLKSQGYHPYFIQGGGHGNIGTQAYVDCFEEIMEYERKQAIRFDYIFLASGTGTTQAGLVCGKIIHHSGVQVVGISIARKNPSGRHVVCDSVSDYMTSIDLYCDYDDAVVFTDEYTCGGYGKCNGTIQQTVKDMMRLQGVPLSTTYTGKAFWGMNEYVKANCITGKNILFIHTGGIPLFFDDMEKIL